MELPNLATLAESAAGAHGWVGALLLNGAFRFRSDKAHLPATGNYSRKKLQIKCEAILRLKHARIDAAAAVFPSRAAYSSAIHPLFLTRNSVTVAADKSSRASKPNAVQACLPLPRGCTN